jgi:hypothetical protein
MVTAPISRLNLTIAIALYDKVIAQKNRHCIAGRREAAFSVRRSSDHASQDLSGSGQLGLGITVYRKVIEIANVRQGLMTGTLLEIQIPSCRVSAAAAAAMR